MEKRGPGTNEVVKREMGAIECALRCSLPRGYS